MKKKYIVTLSESERQYLNSLVDKGKNSASRIKHANILLKADAGSMPDNEIARQCRCHLNTVANVRQRFVEEGLESALERKAREKPPISPKLDGEKEARLIALACSSPPEGHARWTLQLLASSLVELSVVDSLSTSTVYRTLKKNELKPHLRRQWVIPPEQHAAFVAQMEEILDLYQQSFDPSIPVVCMDEQPVQLIEEKHNPRAAGPGASERYDYEYKRNGTAEVFIFTEPLGGFRRVTIRERKTGLDWAQEIQELLETDYPHASKIRLIGDNYATPKISFLYEAFPAEQARKLARRLEIHYTPIPGSWLNIAELELSVLTRQCLDRRIPTLELLRSQTKAWELERNAKCKTIDWQFTTAEARIKLKRLYPQFKQK